MKYLTNSQKNKKNEHLAERILNEFSDDILIEKVINFKNKIIAIHQKVIETKGEYQPTFLPKSPEVAVINSRATVEQIKKELEEITIEKIRNNPHDYAGCCGYHWHQGEYKKSN